MIFVCVNNVMLGIAQNYSDSFDIKFNISKSFLVAYNKHGMIKYAVTFNNVTIESRGQGKQIGISVGFDTNLDAIVSGVSVFQRKLNVMMLKFKFISSDALYVNFVSLCFSRDAMHVLFLCDQMCVQLFPLRRNVSFNDAINFYKT